MKEDSQLILTCLTFMVTVMVIVLNAISTIFQLYNQSLFFLLNAACLAEKQQIPVFDLTQSELEPTIYGTRGLNANH